MLPFRPAFRCLAALFVALALTVPAAAPAADLPPDLRPVVLPPITHRAATLAVVDADGRRHLYSPAELERFPTYRLVTSTPWRDAPATFEGILLLDLLAAHGLAAAAEVEVLAENDFSTRIEQAALATGAFLIATRVDGRAHTRRARGPIQLVLPHALYTARPELRERHLVWMAAEIRLPAGVAADR